MACDVFLNNCISSTHIILYKYPKLQSFTAFLTEALRNSSICPRHSVYTDARCTPVCVHTYVYHTLQSAQRPPVSEKRTALLWEVNLLQQVECQGWVAVDSREHHHLTKQSDLNGLLYLYQSLQDHLKYCWVPLKGGDKGLELE